MPEENNEQILQRILENFGKYSRCGETLRLDDENVVYNYIRDCQDPSYAGTLHDRTTFKKSALMELIAKTLSSPSRQESLTTEGMRKDFDDTESIYTGHNPGNVGAYETQVTLELKIEEGIPIFRTDDMWPLHHLKVR